MLYNSNQKKVGGINSSDDPFNVKKARAEADQDTRDTMLAQRQREKRQLEMQAENRKREAERIKVALHSKESLVANLTHEIEIIKKELSELKRFTLTAGGTQSQKKNIKSDSLQNEIKLKKSLEQKERVSREIQKLMAERNLRNNDLRSLENEQTVTERKEVSTGFNANNNQEVTLGRKLADQQRSLELLSQNIERLKAELNAKVLEKNNLVIEIRGLEAKLKIAASDNAKAKQGQFLSKKESDNLKTMVSSAKKALVDFDRQINILQNEKIKLESEITNLERLIMDGKNQEDKEKREEIYKVKKGQETEAGLNTKERQIAVLEQQQEHLNQEVSKVKAELNAKEEEIKNLLLKAGKVLNS